MFSEGWPPPEGPQIGPKIDFSRYMGHFWIPLECYYFKVGVKGAFLEKGRQRAGPSREIFGARGSPGNLS